MMGTRIEQMLSVFLTFTKINQTNMKKLQSYINNNGPRLIKIAYCLFILLVITGITAHAQVPDPGGDVDNAPIDGGLSLLVAAGVGYGAKKLKEKKAMANTKKIVD